MKNNVDSKEIFCKVPEITLMFWLTKILTTGLGEVFSDFLCKQFDPIYPVAITGVALVISLCLQIFARKYIAWIYWLSVAMVSIFGTMAADVLHVGLGIPYYVTTTFFLLVLSITFITWNKVERTLDIHSIFTKRREVFYWIIVMTTFALGTATGDLTASTLEMGYFTSGLLFTMILFVPIILHKLFKINEVFAFWFAYIMTRPVGASFADWIGVPLERKGLGLGTGWVSLVLGLVFLVIVGILTIRQNNHVE